MNEFSFKKGYDQLKIKDLRKARRDLMTVLGITSRPAFLSRLRGDVIPKMNEKAMIEEVFGKYGITDVWGV